ncbi:MAG: hypothetical protein ACYC6L_08445 [Anaerolineae bacterium]
MVLRRKSWLVCLIVGLILLLVLTSSVGAQSELGLIRGDPLTIQSYSDGSLQVWHRRYTQGASFGTAGSGFFIALDKATYGYFTNSMDLVEQKPTEGRGTRADPYRSVLHNRINTGTTTLDVTQRLLYINGASSFQLEWTLLNTGNNRVCLTAYHAADLYFADDDYGIGYYNANTHSVGGYNQAKDWFMVFTPLSDISHYEENYYGTIWDRVQNQENLQDSISSDYIDNGAALQWDFCLAAGQSKTISDAWSFGENEGAIVAAAEQASGASAAGATDAYGGGTQTLLGLSAPRFRPIAPGSPALTTSIPTPLDISLDPKVVGMNLIWAALATILFTIASEILNRTLAHNEAFFQRIFKPFKSISQWRKKSGLAEKLGHPHWYEWFKLVVIMVIYGLVFSTLDKTWQPFTFNGVWLFISMTIAFGIVGLADDITQWSMARRWNLPTRITIKPGNLLLAVLSALFSRGLALVPGVMFGTPEAFDIEESALSDSRRSRLLLLAGGVLVAILLISWLPTTLLALIQNTGTAPASTLQSILLVPIAALQSLLLVIFAVTVQNLFLHMMALPDTIGEMIKRKSLVAWLVTLLLTSFIFLHTLLNPNGDLAHSLQASNVRVFFATITLFLFFTLVMRGLLKRSQTKLSRQPSSLTTSGWPLTTQGAEPAKTMTATPISVFGQAPTGRTSATDQTNAGNPESEGQVRSSGG